MYRSQPQPVGMSGFFDSLFKGIKGAVSGIKITAPPINLPQFPTTVQIPGTSAPQPAPVYMNQGTPDWVLPVGIGVAGLLAVMMMNKGRR